MTRAVILVAVAALCSLAAAAPAGAAKPRIYGFDVLDARVTEVMTFHGDGGPACQRAGVCDYSGTVRFSFEHADGFAGFILRGHHATGVGGYSFGGLTTASVQGPAGTPPCTDKVLRRFDGFVVRGTASRIRLVFHSPIDAPDFLNTYCAGPSDADISHTQALPDITLSERSLRRRSLLLQTSSTRTFHSGPFEGRVDFSVAIRLRRSRATTVLFGLFFG